MLLLVLFAVGLFVWSLAMNYQQMKARERTHRYAVTMAERFDATDPRGQAYSDMATVIILGGKAEPRKWTDA